MQPLISPPGPQVDPAVNEHQSEHTNGRLLPQIRRTELNKASNTISGAEDQ